MKKTKLLEQDIKALLVNYLYKKNHIKEKSILISELTIGNFLRRVDFATVTPSELIAYEIKSESDNLTRLTGQVNDYLKYFDKVIVIADSKHIDYILKQTPNKVGVWEVNQNKIIIRRRGVKEKIKDKSSISSFLTDAQIRKKTRPEHRLSDKNTRLESMIKSNSMKSIREEVYNFLSEKFYNNSKEIMKKLSLENKINSSDIEKLSNYIKERRAIKEKKALKSKLWKSWEADISSKF